MKALLEENLKRLQTTSTIDREIALRSVNWPLYYQWKGRQSCLQKAAAKPLPGGLLGAFFDKSIRVGDKDVCRIVPAHFFVLQKIESKLLDMLSGAEANGKSDGDLSEHEKWKICWLFTHNPKEMFDLVETHGPAALWEQAKSIAVEWPAEQVESVVLAVIEQIKRHAETKARLVSDMKKEGSLSFFREPEKQPNLTSPA
jgi:hypothetical protein